MVMSKHTPGPWTVRGYKTKTGGTWIDGGFVRNRACGTIAEVYPLTHHDANVHLIAAAPELLGAAELAMEGIEVLDLLIASIEEHGNYSVESTLGFLNQARCAKLRLSEAIAKAEGK